MANTNQSKPTKTPPGAQGEQAHWSQNIKQVQKDIKSGPGAGKPGVVGKVKAQPSSKSVPRRGR